MTKDAGSSTGPGRRIAAASAAFMAVATAVSILGVRAASTASATDGRPVCARTDQIADLRMIVDPSSVGSKDAVSEVRGTMAAFYPGFDSTDVAPIELGSRRGLYGIRLGGRVAAVVHAHKRGTGWSAYRIVACNADLVQARRS